MVTKKTTVPTVNTNNLLLYLLLTCFLLSMASTFFIYFKYLSLKYYYSTKGQFCGGIANIRCPDGYRCQLEGNFPDAGGQCLK